MLLLKKIFIGCLGGLVLFESGSIAAINFIKGMTQISLIMYCIQIYFSIIKTLKPYFYKRVYLIKLIIPDLCFRNRSI